MPCLPVELSGGWEAEDAAARAHCKAGSDPGSSAWQARLAELYPEFSICPMPCSAVEPPDDYWEADDDAAAVPLSAFVGNAVEAGQACSWHTDFDPFHAPVGSPWEARYGRYGNRQVGTSDSRQGGWLKD